MTMHKKIKLPTRKGQRPETGEIPHLQHTDQSPRDIYDRMARWGLDQIPKELNYVLQRPTAISVPTTKALWLDDAVPARKDAFMPPPGSREFAHLHADGSWHLVVDEEVVQSILDARWGERHPWYHKGVLEVMVYAPRDDEELEIVKQLVIASIEHASNKELSAGQVGKHWQLGLTQRS